MALKMLPPRNDKESDVEYLKRVHEGGIDVDEPSVATAMRIKHGVRLPDGMKMSDLILNQGHIPGRDEMQKRIEDVAKDVISGQLTLSIAMRWLIQKGASVLDQERLLNALPSGLALSSRWRSMNQTTQCAELSAYDARTVLIKSKNLTAGLPGGSNKKSGTPGNAQHKTGENSVRAVKRTGKKWWESSDPTAPKCPHKTKDQLEQMSKEERIAHFKSLDQWSQKYAPEHYEKILEKRRLRQSQREDTGQATTSEE